MYPCLAACAVSLLYSSLFVKASVYALLVSYLLTHLLSNSLQQFTLVVLSQHFTSVYAASVSSLPAPCCMHRVHM